MTSAVAAAACRIAASSGAVLRLRTRRTSSLPATHSQPCLASAAQAQWISPAGARPASATRPGATPLAASARDMTQAR